MKRSRSVRTAVFLSAALVVAAQAEAQLFGSQGRSGRSGIVSLRERAAGNRKPRGSTASKSKPVADEFIDENARYLRENRSAGDFVGSDSRELKGFVGMQQGETEGAIRSAVEGNLVRTAPTPTVNRQLALPPRLGMYRPRLALGFAVTRPPAPAVGLVAARSLELSPSIHSTRPFEVSMAGRSATLRGAVASAHEKKLAALMLLFEPGISEVKNELEVLPVEVAPPTRPALGPEPGGDR